MIDHLNSLKEEISLAQNHNGISGTAKYWVYEDMIKRIESALRKCRIDLDLITKEIYFSNEPSGDKALNGNVDKVNSNYKSTATIIECSLISEAKNYCLN